MQRLTQPFVSDVRRPRHGENLRLRPGSKRLPITSLWDEMASAAPVEVEEPLYPRSTSASGWDGRPFADDDDSDVPEVVIRHVSAMTEAAALFSAPGPSYTGDEGSGVHVVELRSEGRTASEWPRAATPSRAHPGLRATLLGLGLVLIAAVTWRLTASNDAVARASTSAATPTVLAAAPMSAPEPELAPAQAIAAPPADIAALAPEPASPEPAAPPVAAVTPAIAAGPAAAGSDAGFDYRSARRYLDEQAGFLRQTCMHKAKTPVKRLRIHVKARPNGRAAIAVPGVGPEVADCVRRALSFPFDRSPHGGAFLYSLGTTSSRLEQRPL